MPLRREPTCNAYTLIMTCAIKESIRFYENMPQKEGILPEKAACIMNHCFFPEKAKVHRG